MSETAKLLFDGLKAAANAAQELAPGLKNIGPDIGAELSRMGSHGATELAAALFNDHAFVLYGPGQRPPQPELEQGTQDRGIER